MVLEPDETFVPELRQGFRNPDSVEFECSQCGAKTRANRRTGRLYSHPIPESTEVCRASASVVLDAEGGAVPTLERVEEPPQVSDVTVRVREEESNSVRTVSGGLPTLGRRRR